MSGTALKAENLSEAELQALEHFLSLSAKKQERVCKLAAMYSAAVGDEKEEIVATLAEVLFRKKVDLNAEPLENGDANKEAKSKLANYRKYVAKQIALQRAKRGWTQEELAEKAGLPQSHVSRLERCVHAPTYLTLQKIADALGIEPSVLDFNFPDEQDD